MSRVLAIGDLHIPFHHSKYLGFVKQVKKDFKCDTVVFMGDEADNHAISYHERNPDGMSPGHEYQRTKDELKDWFAAFPSAFTCISNHGSLIYRKAVTHGLPSEVFKAYRDLWCAPRSWQWELRFVFDGVQYIHGTGFSGVNAAITAAKKHRMSTVIGHVHSHGGVIYSASNKDLIFGLNAGCGIDPSTYAFEYGKDFAERPTLGCGVVLDGKQAMFVPMEMG